MNTDLLVVRPQPMASADVLYVAGSLEGIFPCTPRFSSPLGTDTLQNNYVYMYVIYIYCHLLSHYVLGTTYFMCVFSFNVNTVLSYPVQLRKLKYRKVNRLTRQIGSNDKKMNFIFHLVNNLIEKQATQQAIKIHCGVTSYLLENHI